MMKNILIAAFVLSFSTAAFAADGAAIFASKCKSCHGADAKGAKMAPNAIAGTDAAAVKKAVTEGKGKMKPVKISAEDVDAVAAYVAGLAK